MSVVIKAAVILALLVEAVAVLFAVAGLHESNPVFGIVFLVLVIGLNVACVFWVLKRTAADNGYGKQLLNATVLGLVAGTLIFVLSVVNLKLLFPDYIEQSNTAMLEFFEGLSMPEAALEQQAAKLEARTAVGESLNALIGTFFTSLIGGAIVAIFKRKK